MYQSISLSEIDYTVPLCCCHSMVAFSPVPHMDLLQYSPRPVAKCVIDGHRFSVGPSLTDLSLMDFSVRLNFLHRTVICVPYSNRVQVQNCLALFLHNSNALVHLLNYSIIGLE